MVNPISMPQATIASYAVSTTNLEFTTNAKAYRPWFENGAWQGDLIQYDLSNNGVITTSVVFNTSPPTNTAAAPNWSARLEFDAAIKANAFYHSNVRKVITRSNVAGSPLIQIPFTWASLSGSQQASLDATPVSAIKSIIVDFIRGDRSNESDGTITGGSLRQRYNVLGDIIHSDPVYVGSPNSGFYDPGYSTFKTNNTPRAGRVYVGANDGMLHAFDAATGQEAYAYIPSMLIGKLSQLANLPYTHQYYVDGALASGDMDFGSSDWRTVLIGSLGAGGKGLFALDVTNPVLSDQAGTTPADTKILWELDGIDTAILDNDSIGYIYDKAEIGKLPDGSWSIITGNGYGSISDTASLLLINSSGTITRIEADDAIVGNGLSRPALIDINGDNLVDYAYAGDLKGNLYRFDLNNPTTKAFKVFSAGVDKPITTAPQISNHPFGGYMILFATGSLLSQADFDNVSIQSIYGLRDNNNTTIIANTTTNLVTQTLSPDFAVLSPAANRADTVRYMVNPKTMDWTTNDGWQVDLPAGERVSLDTNLRAQRFQVMSVNPVSQEAWLIQLNYLDGTIKNIFYDLDNSGNFTTSGDTVNQATDAQGNLTSDIPVAIRQNKNDTTGKMGTGVFSRQLIVRVKNGIDANYINGLGITPIVQDPPGNPISPTGFKGGHIDVDTDSPGGGMQATNLIDRYCYVKGDRAVGVAVDANGNPATSGLFTRNGVGSKTQDGYSGETDGHQHEYDKIHGLVEVDYVNLEGYCVQQAADGSGTANTKLSRVTEVGIGNAKEFFVIVANADFSPSSIMNIAEQSWNVVEYQKLIQQKLRAWIASAVPPTLANFKAAMNDVNGKSLIFTLDQILATVNNGTGKFSHAFTDRSIIDGGLHPTVTGCVRKTSSITNNRWRNGALVTQLISVNDFIADVGTVVEQVPTDLPTQVIINGTKAVVLKEGGVVYGGLYANDNGSSTGIGAANKAFLYESTLFWHFGDLFKSLYTVNSKQDYCYGGPLWGLAQVIETSGLTQAELAAIIGDTTTAAGAAEKAYQDAVNAGAPAAVIQDKLNKLDIELAKLAGKPQGQTPGGGMPAQTTTVTPAVTGDPGVDDPKIKGPKSNVGRRSWIDIRP